MKLTHADHQKIQQLIGNDQPANVLLGLELIKTLSVESLFATHIAHLAYFSGRQTTKVKEVAQSMFKVFISDTLHTQLKQATDITHFPEEVLDAIGILIKADTSHSPAIDFVYLIQCFLKDYYYHADYIIEFLVTHQISFEHFDFTKKMERITISGDSPSAFEAYHLLFPSIKTLTIRYNSLSTLPLKYEHLHQLNSLYISDSQLNQLPENLDYLPQLQTLHVNNTLLDQLPDTLAQAAQLSQLNLENNHISALPSNIGKLKNLKDINLANNQVRQLPASFQELTQLNSLSLQSNRLSEFPSEVIHLKNLTGLMLANNSLTHINQDLSELASLKYLHLEQNNFATVPERLRDLPCLSYLSMAQNQLTQLPHWLTRLPLRFINLSNNQLRHFSATMVNQGTIQEIVLSGNPIPATQIRQLRLNMPTVAIVF